MKKFFMSLSPYFVFAFCFFAAFGAAGAGAVFAAADNGNVKESSSALYKTKEEVALAKKTADARIKAAREAKKKAEEEIARAEEMKRQAELEEKKILAAEKKKEREKLRFETAERNRKEAERKETALRAKQKALQEKKALASAKEKAAAEEKKRGQARKKAAAKAKADEAGKARLENAARQKVKKDKDGVKAGRVSGEKQSSLEKNLKKEAEKAKNKRAAERKEKKSGQNEKKQAFSAPKEEKAGNKTVTGQGKEDAGKKSSEKEAAGALAGRGQEKALTGETAENSDEKLPKPDHKEIVRLSFILPQKKLFADSSHFVLTKDGIREVWKSVDAILLYIEENPGKKFKIYVEGYSDSSGGERINRQYSLKRAEAVAGEMAVSDINNEIIETKGLGAVNFVNKKNTMAGVNRRVEIKLVTIE